MNTVNDFSLLNLTAIALRHRRTLFGLPILFVIIGVALTFAFPYAYSADSSFRPQTSDQSAGRLAGLAAQFGVAIPGGSSGDPIKFYSELLISRRVLEPVVLTTYSVNAPGVPANANLLTYLRANGKDSADSLRQGIDRLRSHIEVLPDRDAGIIHLSVNTKWPGLSEAVNRRILNQLDAANTRNRQVTASAEREFVEQRMIHAKADLDQAEDALASFSTANRSYHGSPALETEFGRLQRRVDLRQQVYSSLAQSYEQSRIDEVRNTPSIVLIDTPEGSGHRLGSRRKDAIMWFIVGFMIALSVIVVREYLEYERRVHPEAIAALRVRDSKRHVDDPRA